MKPGPHLSAYPQVAYPLKPITAQPQFFSQRVACAGGGDRSSSGPGSFSLFLLPSSLRPRVLGDEPSQDQDPPFRIQWQNRACVRSFPLSHGGTINSPFSPSRAASDIAFPDSAYTHAGPIHRSSTAQRSRVLPHDEECAAAPGRREGRDARWQTYRDYSLPQPKFHFENLTQFFVIT